jgi:hypothetical protein
MKKISMLIMPSVRTVAPIPIPAWAPVDNAVEDEMELG